MTQRREWIDIYLNLKRSLEVVLPRALRQGPTAATRPGASRGLNPLRWRCCQFYRRNDVIPPLHFSNQSTCSKLAHTLPCL